jgi:dipeptidyl aminopeptidase/acylaminoacyl peptidase
MIRKTSSYILVLFAVTLAGRAQEELKYQVPPDEIVRIIDAPVTPVISVSPDKSVIILVERPPIITIKELSAPELRLAGLRIDPSTSGPSRQTFNTGFRIMDIDGNNLRGIKGMPAIAGLGYPEWAPDGKKFAFTNTTENGIELWVCDINSSEALKIADRLNLVFRGSVNWLSDSKTLIYSVIDPGRGNIPQKSQVPQGPVIQVNLGAKGEAPTYQDLLKDPVDEEIFEYFARSQLMIWDGNKSEKLGKPGMITDATPSPDGKYLLVSSINRPFSYIVPYNRFPTLTEIWDITGKSVKILNNKPLNENQPRGYDMVLTGPRFYGWRQDVPSTVFWVEALDSGDYSNEMKFHDQVYLLDAPFSGNAAKSVATEMRFNGISWGDKDFALVYEGLSRTRIRRTSSFSPADPEKPVKKLFELNSDDRYNDPGRFLSEMKVNGGNVLLFTDNGRSLILSGAGASPEGDRPFLDRYIIETGKTERLWRSEAPYYETFYTFLDTRKGLILTSRQSESEVPNYFIRNLRNKKLIRVTNFENPYPQLAGIQKELVKYKRSDSLELSFTLYLPEGFTRGKDAPLPTLLWAYPREFNDPSSAGQTTGSPYTFTRVSPSSVLVYVIEGYAILMDASFPIVGTEGKEPNDTFVEQLVANAEAAINKAVSMGVTDRSRVAVSGHSYGAFMTANLLAHSRLFAAGIAESGAYNRTLTPFGFQNERRSYWDAPDIYNRMSPFMNADKVKDPLMLIHGMADNNSGTFPIQSERFYAALKGFGATVRLVLLPLESHGYAARESILHKHWEVLNWLNKYVRDKNTEGN